MMQHIKIIVEQHEDGFVAYPLGVEGVVVGQGDTFDEALRDVQSAIRCHIEEFGPQVIQGAPGVQQAFVADFAVAV
jgi:predicted RNase H-like HicB family nuclease